MSCRGRCAQAVPRRYCSQACGYAAANKRRPLSPAIVALEIAVRRADQAAQQAWADVAAAEQKIEAARRQLEEGKAARFQEEKDKARVQSASAKWRPPDEFAQAAVDKALGLFPQVVAAAQQYAAAGPDDKQYCKELLDTRRDTALDDPLARLVWTVNGYEEKRAPLQAVAEAASADAEMARAALNKARRRLDQRAKQARIRRAIGAGREPEELEEQGPEDADDGQAVYPSWHAKAGEPIN